MIDKKNLIFNDTDLSSWEPLNLFLHIPKTGGSSFRAILDRQFAPDQILEINPRTCQEDQDKLEKEGLNAIGDFGFKKMHQQDLDQFIAFVNKPDSRAIIGHFTFGLHTYTTRPCKYFTFFRKPEMLVISLYYEMFKSDDEFDVNFVKQFSDLDAFVKQVHNIQTFILSGLSNYKDMHKDPDAAFLIAKQNIDDHFFHIGTIENFRFSIKKISKILKWKNALAIPHLKKGNYTLPQSDSEISKMISQYNYLDIELYDYIQKKFNKGFFRSINWL